MATKNKLPTAKPPSNRPWLVRAAVIALLAWYFATAVSAVSDKCTTFDEVFHLTGGYCSWKFGDFRMQPENGNLPQRWAAIPLLFGNTHFPDLDQDFWRQSNMHEIGEQFLYNVGNDADAIMLRGRAMIALLGVAFGVLLFFWSRSLLGVGPALLSLALFAFCPTVLANGALVTSDMAVALFFAASMFCIWMVLHRLNWKTLLVSSLVMGCLFVSKFSAVLLVPMGLLLVAIQLLSKQPAVITLGRSTWEIRRRLPRLGVHLVTIAIHAVVVWIIIWTFFDFRYDMLATKKLETKPTGETTVVDHPYLPWTFLLKQGGVVENSIDAMREYHILPEAYLYGFATTWRFSKERVAFFNGDHSTSGWRGFFPYCWLVKTPLPLFVLLALAIAAIVRGWLRAGDDWQVRKNAMLTSLYRTAPVWTLFVVYWAFAITSHLNIGHRHILPTYLPMLMLAGAAWFWTEARSRAASHERSTKQSPAREQWRAARWFSERRWPGLTGVVLIWVAIFASESLWRWPNYLAYFNQIAGGPSSAYQHLVESSLDWGQDLPALKRWLDKNKPAGSPAERTYLAYFGSGNPEYYGIRESLLPGYKDRMPPRIPEPLEPGTYCISATLLQNVYTIFPGRWSQQYEDIYKKVFDNVKTFVESPPEGRSQLIARTGENFWLTLFRQYEHLRLARLTSFLRRRQPDDEINASILVYRLNASDLSRAVDGPPTELEQSSFSNYQLIEFQNQPK